jgi:hypothetical protein
MNGSSKHLSNASSIRSSVSSIFSQASSSSYSITSSILDSPTSSDSDTRPPSIIYRPQPLRAKKNVSFSSLVPETISESDDEGDLLDRFPSPPSHDHPSPTTIPSLALETRTQSEHTQAQTLALTRYHTHLSTLTTQLTYHSTSIRAQIHTLSLIRQARRSNLPDLFYSGAEEGRKVDLQERIRRGRESGWVRKRFEGERYRELCERAVGEIEGGMF